MNDRRIRRRKRRWVLFSILLILLISLLYWKIRRSQTSISCTPWNQTVTCSNSEEEKFLSALSLSYFVYGCEGCEDLMGTVSYLLDHEKMGILLENADILRTDPKDPASALIDSSAFIRQVVGNYRFLIDLKEESSSFYGAAFADDASKTVWIAYSGSVSLTDSIQSALLVMGAGLTDQEKSAFELYEKVINTDEIQNQGYSLILTGHSLGGGLAAMVSRMSGAEAFTLNGAVGVALDKINDIAGGKPEHYSITNYLIQPKNTQNSFKDWVQRLMFLGSFRDTAYHVFEDNGLVENTHCIFGLVKFENGDLTKPGLPNGEIEGSCGT